MDPSSVVLPGAQALVSQILSDSWVQVRTWLARHWSQHDIAGQADFEQRLDAANTQAATLLVPGTMTQQAVLEAYWAGYLAALLAERPEFSGSLKELAEAPLEHSGIGETSNSVTGTVHGNVVQARDIEGGIRFSR